MASTLHTRFPFLCFILLGQSSHPLVILSMYGYLMHVNIHRHFICLSCTDGEIFIQKKVGDRYWQAQNIRKGTKVNLLQEFWNNNPQTLSTLNVHLTHSSAVHWCECCGLTWIKFLWYLHPWHAHPHLNKVNIQLSRPPQISDLYRSLKYVLNPELFLSWAMAFQAAQPSVQVSKSQLQKDVDSSPCWVGVWSDWALVLPSSHHSHGSRIVQKTMLIILCGVYFLQLD